ncbi:MAG: hypothetical protein O3B13_07180 [Planctomycetota bacterium]|nr:hypothetical protein [Planctomycetota bacterium]MDA1162866.1 hypothetical protein [Planctomycetota bacterium]
MDSLEETRVMAVDDEYDQIAEWLKNEKGHSSLETEKIILRLRHYEKNAQLNSVMDSIGSGSLDLFAIINEALADDGDAGK